MLSEWPWLNDKQDSHLSQASTLSVMLKQLMVLASMRAQVVFPTPRGPQNKKACARCLLLMAFFKVEVMLCWPTTVSKVAGRYLRADTTKSLIKMMLEHKYKVKYECKICC